MATQNVNIGINVSDNGTAKKVVQSFKEITNEATKAQRAAESISVPAGGTSGSRTVAAKYAAPSGSERMMSGQEYGRARAGGASARDFANQAQGLGGLVRLYATYAANLFAAEAAFRALSNAADTSNMVKGLDQLSVAGGKSLGSLSKQLVATTDGAISMQESMTAVAQSSAAGLSSANILRLGEVAKKTSQALGLSMPDAISRLSRGISKIEPELLDELGIFVKIDQASQDYARSIGKTASTLTDFEKRQGFANAVLTQAEEKFSNIKLDANPYTKLIASMKDLAQTGLELINKVLTPIISLLSASPIGLATVMTTIGVMLLKQAIPALKEYKQYLNSIAETSSAQAKARMELSRTNAAKEYAILEDLTRDRDMLAGKAAEKEFLLQKTTIEKINALQKTRVSSEIVGAPVRGLLKKSAFDLSADDLNAIKDRASILLQSDDALHVKQGEKLYKYLEKTNKLYLEADRINNEATEASIAKDLAGTKQLQDSKEKYGKLNKQLALDSIRSSAIDIQAKEGMLSAIKKVNTQLAQARQGTLKIDGIDETIPKITALERGITTMGVAFDLSKAKAVSWVSKLGNSLDKLGMIGQVVGIAIAAFELLDSSLSTAAKEIKAYDNSLEAAKDSTKLLKDVSSDLAKQDAAKFLSAESMQARSNAINEATTSIKNMLKTLDKAQLESNWWDNLFDGLFSKSRLQKTADSIVLSIKESIKLARPSAAKDLFAAKVLQITGSSSLETVDTSKLTRESLAELSSVYEQFSAKLTKSSADISAPKKAFEALNKTFQDLSATLLPTDNISKFAMAMFDTGVSIQALTADTDAYFEQLRSIASSNLQISMLGLNDKDQKALQDASPQLNKISVQYNALAKAVQEANAIIEKNTLIIDANIAASQDADESQQGFYQSEILRFTELNKAQKATVDNASIAIAALTKEKQDFNAKFVDVGRQAITEGIRLFGQSLNLVIEQGTLKLANAIAGAITGAGSAEAKASVAFKEIDLRVAGNNIMADLIVEQQKATLALEANTTSNELSLIESKLRAGDLKGAELKDAQYRKEQLEANKKVISSAQELLQGSRSGLLARVEKASKAGGTEAQAAATLKTTAFGVAKTGAENVAAGEEKKAVALNKQLGLVAEKYATINRETSTRITLLETEYKDASQLAGMSNSFALQDLANQKAITIENEKAKLLTQERTKLDEEHAIKLAAAEKAGSNSAALIKAENKSYNDQVVSLGQKLDIQTASNKAAKLARDLADITKKATEEIYRLDGLKLAQDQASAKETGGLTNRLAELEALKSTGGIQQEYYLREKAILDQKSLTANKTKEQNDLEDAKLRAVNAATVAYASQLKIINQSKLTEAEKSSATLAAQAQLTEASSRANSILTTGLGLSNAKFETDSKILAQTLEQNIQLEKQNQLLTSASDFADALKMGFEGAAESSQKIASALGTVATTMAQVAVNAENRAIAEKKAQEAVDKAKENSFATEDYAAITAAENSQAELKKKNARQELADNIKLINSQKKVFSEKTTAYKTLDGLEKIRSAKSIALNLKEFAIKSGLLKQEQLDELAASAKSLALKASDALKSIGIDIPAIYASFMATMGPWGAAAAGAAIAAFVGGAFGGGGGGPAFVPTAEQRQGTQGTAMGYDSQGNKIQTRRGVFGDTEAKSESIAKSLEIIKDNSVEGLSYDNKMLNALTNLTKSLETAAKSLYGITGLRTGSLSGITEGTNTGGGLLGIGGLFSKSTTKEIIDSGIQLKGTFLELIQGIKGTINTFETVSTTVKKSGFFGIGGSTKTSVSTEFTDLAEKNPKAFKAISDSFGFAAKLLYSTAELAGIADTVVETAISKVPVDELVSLRGLKGEELTKELSAVISAVLDDASLAIFSSFEGYAKFGEGMLETVQRVIDSNKKVNQQVKNLGIDISGLTFAVTETLVDLAGGLEKFLEQSNFFRENFLTEAERLTPVQKAVTEEMARLKFASVDTRAEFKLLVQGLDLNTEAGRENYQALMNVAEGFDQVATAAENLANSAKSLLTKYVELSGTESEIINMQREAILAGTDPALVAAQKYIFALEDVKTAQTNLTNARKTEGDSLKTTVSNLKNYADSLRKFNQSLLLGAQSTLTPQQKYLESKSQFDAILATATKPATTAAEKADRDAAIGQLQGASSAFLDASRIYNASSAQYTEDFSLVQRALSSTADALDAQSTDAEKQLSALNLINDSVLSVTDAIAKLDLAKQVADGLKTAGISSYAGATKTATVTGGTVYGTQGSTIDLASAKTFMINAVSEISASSNPEPMVRGLYDMLTTTWGLNSYQVADVSGYSRQQVLDYFGAWGLPAFAAGTNYVPEDMLAQIHRGERIIPAADNEQLMQSLNSRDEANRVLVTEIRNLRNEVKQLRDQQAKETGNIIMANLDAQQRNAEHIGEVISTTTQQSDWNAKVKEAVKLR